MSDLPREQALSRPRPDGAVALTRGIASWAHLLLALAVGLGVFAQVYLIGAYLFGAGQGALDAHRSAGFAVHMLEVFVLLAALVAWLPRREVAVSALLAAVGTGQVFLVDGERWVGALHALFALFVLALATLLLHAHVRRRAS